MAEVARALWVTEPGHAELRDVSVPDPGPEEVLVRTIRSGVSRGTEALVFGGRVPPDQYAVMRAPFQEGELPGPVKYGYLSVGTVAAGAPDLVGRTVFCLYPHQTAYVVPAAAVIAVPDEVPPDRAVLAGTVETAINALWDAGPLLGDRISVVGAGMVGACLARLAAGIPGTQVELVDIDPGRREVAAALEVDFAPPDRAARDRDLVFHTSATEAGLHTALGCLATEGTVWELSWYGDRSVSVPLGGAFHSDRLALRASQVGRVAPGRRDTRTPADRLRLALDLLRDPAYDALLSGPTQFEALPDTLARLSDGSLSALCQVVTYE